MREYGNYTEYLSHPKFKTIRWGVLKTANFICQDCKKSRATQVHHLKYPPWGEFDVPANLVAICYVCHCKRHGVDK